MKGKSAKEKERIHMLMSYMGSLSHNLAKLEHEEKKIHRRSFLKLTISSFLIFLCFYFFAFMEILASIRW